MIYIAHRANLINKNPETENTISAIKKCLDLDLYVEIDIWFKNNSFYLGHDGPETKIKESFLVNNKLWCHAKNPEAFFHMSQNPEIHYFWHHIDAYTITSKGFLWACPDQPLFYNTIAVLPEICNYSKLELFNCAGICSDQILGYKNAKNY